MKKLIHIECSPRKKRSVSRKIAEKFIEKYQHTNPEDEVKTIDLWSLSLPEYDEFAADAKFKIFAGEDFSKEEAERWRKFEELFKEFASGDKYLFSVPMWNFSIPYKLKHYIDLITQPKLAFNADENGYTGLVAGKSAAIIYSCGSYYTEKPYSDFDKQKSYMEQWLRFIGFKELYEIRADGTMSPPEERNEAIEKAIETALNTAQKI